MNTILNALSYGGIVAVIGMAVVFFGLFLLILCVSAMAAFFKAKDKKKIETPKAPTAPEAPVAAPVVEEEVVDDAELIAVIAAAIAAFDNSGKTLVVRKVRRVSGWNRVAREEQVCRF